MDFKIINLGRCGNSMNELEGVIKYQLEHIIGELPNSIDFGQLNAWRSLLFDLKLIGRSDEKYQGLGYGNISQRLVRGQQAFLISGTQTGHLPRLNRQDFAIIEAASPRQNSIKSTGPSRPSSEALTHASVYLQDVQAQAVIHVHCPVIWRNTIHLHLPYTDADVDYGSVEMAEAVAHLFAIGRLKTLPLFSMLGHEDGIIAFGKNISSAAIVLITQLARAITIEQTIQAG